MRGSRGTRMPSQTDDGIDKIGVGRRLRLTRLALQMPRGEFAARAGIAANTYNQFEHGARLISPGKATALCEEYNLTLDWIYRGDPSGLPYRLAAAVKALTEVTPHN